MARVDGIDRPIQRAHENFLESSAPSHVPAHVRSVIADSWMRSSAAGVDPETHLAPVLLEPDELLDYRTAHPLSQVFPLLYDVLGRAAVDCDCVMAVGDAEGKLLWVCGPPSVLRKAESIHFVEGSAWDEPHAGTNAPGTALHLDSPVQIASSEHFNRLVQTWSCSAAPIHDPYSNEILGLVDITGGPDVASRRPSAWCGPRRAKPSRTSARDGQVPHPFPADDRGGIGGLRPGLTVRSAVGADRAGPSVLAT